MYRFAPSPTGDMHIGNLRAAIFNYIASLQSDSGFVLRIEDTDMARNIEGKGDEIQEILKIFGIKWNQIYYQSKNLKFHRDFANRLLIAKKAFCCFCTEDELEAKKQKAKDSGTAYRYDGVCQKLNDMEVLDAQKPFVIRMIRPSCTMEFEDMIKGKVSFEPENIDNFVIMRADKTPTYNFACAIDDMLQGVSFIIRGEDHTSNTPKQDWIRECVGYETKISYAHLPIILNSDGKKMSKRENSSSVKWLLASGYLPEAIANYLVLLGNKTPCEVFTLSEAAEWFNIKSLSKSPAKFDIDRLSQLNREHIKRASDERLAELFKMDVSFAPLIKFYTQEASLVGQIKDKIAKIYAPKELLGEFAQNGAKLKEAILAMEIYDDFSDFKKELMQKTALKGKDFFIPLRILLTNDSSGPELGELWPLIKSDIKRIVGI